jgi:hypothetical protein
MIEWKVIHYGDDNLDKIDDDNKVINEAIVLREVRMCEKYCQGWAC